MARFTPGETFADGQQLNAARLNNHVASAIPQDGLIADLAEITATGVSNDDYLMILDSSTNTLKKVSKENIVGSIQNVAVNSIESVPPDYILRIGQTSNTHEIQIGDMLGGGPQTISLSTTGQYDGGIPSISFNSERIEFNTVHSDSSNSGKIVIQGSLDTDGCHIIHSNTGGTTGQAIFQIPAGSTGYRPTLTTYRYAVSNNAATIDGMKGAIRYNTDTSSIEFFDGSEWNSIISKNAVPYKSYKRQVLFPGIATNSSWTLPPYQWESGSNVTIPSGETWTYEWTYAIPKTNDNLLQYDKAKKVCDFVVYCDTTEVKRVPIIGNFSIGPLHILVSHDFTSTDTPVARKIRVRLEKGTGEANTPLPGAQGTVSLTIRPTADSTFVNNNL